MLIKNNIINQIKPHLKQAQQYWLTLEKREQLLLGALSIFLLFVIVFYLTTGVYDLNKNLEIQSKNNKELLSNTNELSKRYKKIQAINTVDFTTVKIDQIKLDITQILDIKDPNTILQDGILSFNLKDINASKYFNLLEKFRKSYGIFPDKVQINKGSVDGLIDVNSSFLVNQ